MSKIEINKLTNANIYLDGVNLLGRAEEVQLPQIKHKMAEHKALGMVGSAEFFAGIDNAKFRRKVCPGDVLDLQVQITRNSRRMCVAQVTALVDGQVAATATQKYVMAPAQTGKEA